MISCICCHYGRTWLLAEAVESFIRQDFDQPAELLVINDHPDITIEQHHDIHERLPEGRTVRFVNWGKRMATLSHKFDYGATLAQYPLILMWDDDDLALPNRLAYSFAEWQLEGKPNYLSFGRHFYIDGKGPHLVARGIHGGDMLTRDAYWQAGGSVGEGHNDQNLVAEIKRLGLYHQLDDCVPTYLYRWTGIAGHHSCTRGTLQDCMDAFDAAVRRDPRYREGVVTIQPGYTDSTEKLVDECIGLAAREARRLHSHMDAV